MLKDAKPIPNKPNKPGNRGTGGTKKPKSKVPSKGDKTPKTRTAKKAKGEDQSGGKPSKRARGNKTPPAEAEAEGHTAPVPKKPKRHSKKA
eukprot:s1279_g6.t1